MPRTIKNFDDRYAEFLTVSQQLFFTKGYDQTSVQNIIDAMGVAKGTFYHYFRSKVELLDALVLDMYSNTLKELSPMVASPTLTATQKLEKLFQHIHLWQSENCEFLIATAKILYQEANTLMLVKTENASRAMLSPLLSDILQQGVESKEFSLKYPKQIAEIIINMESFINNEAVSLVIAERCTTAEVAALTQTLLSFRYAMARLIGINEDRLNIINLDELPLWLPTEGMTDT